MERINVGFIGCGRIADLHAAGYRGHPRARLHAVCDADAGTVARRRSEWGVPRAFTDYREMLADRDLDAVEILTPQPLHEEMALAAAVAGRHVALQKPMTVDLASADRIRAAFRDRDLVLRVTDNYLFYPPLRLARRLIDEGAVGTPTNLRIKMISGGGGGWDVPPAAWAWRLREREAGRGMQTFDHGHHMWATAWYLLGPVERVTAWIDSVDGIIDSPAVIMWKHAGGPCYGQCEFAHAADLTVPSEYYANDEWIEVTGSRGILHVPRCTGTICEGPGLRLFTSEGWRHFGDVPTDWGEGFRGATANFVSAVRGEEPPLLDGDQAREVLRFALAVGRSARLRREVYPGDLDAPWPWRYRRRRLRAERNRKETGRGLRARLMPGRGDAAAAGEAEALTLAFVQRFDPAAAGDWRAVVGLHLLPEGAAPEMRFCLRVGEGKAELAPGPWPADAALVLHAPAGTWAAILAGRRRIETAFLQGRLKLDGKAEVGLKLRAAFGI